MVHRDLKPENLLLTKNNKLKIIDFGLCHDFNGTKLLITKCGSPSYAAPEILLGYPYNGCKIDIMVLWNYTIWNVMWIFTF